MKILYIGNFKKMWDEEYIAQAFESIGHEVGRVSQSDPKVVQQIADFKPDIVLWAKLQTPKAMLIIEYCKRNNIKTVCWVWDLYWGYAPREYKIKLEPMFKADYVFTSDGGHQDKWESIGVKHKCIRQGIHEPECYREKGELEYDILFVGSDNAFNQRRNGMIKQIEKDFKLHWVGKTDTDEARGPKLNRLLGKAKIVVGDSVYSPITGLIG